MYSRLATLYIEHHIVQSLSYHSVEVNEIEIIDIATSWLVPSKEDGSMVVNTSQSEIGTGRRSGPSDSRGEPDTCRSLYINVCTFNELDYDNLD